jgi:transcriptional regulator with GAF, ATPase, and Fis domain
MSRDARLGEVFVELADTLVTDFDIVDFMTTLAARSVELLHADAVGIMLRDDGNRPRVVASSSEAMNVLELFELQVAEGPCIECFESGEAVVNVSLGDAFERWPSFSAEAEKGGFSLVHALPMRLRNEVIGAMNLFSTSTVPLDHAGVQLGQAMADVATIGMLQERALREARVLAQQLETALHTRIVIEQAKGVLAERLGIEIPESFELMRTYARRHGTLLAEVALGVANGSLATGDLT